MTRRSMCWIGLIPLLAIWGLANWVKTQPIEAELIERARRGVADAGLDAGGVAIAGRDVSLAGLLFEEKQRGVATARAESVSGVRLVNVDGLNPIPVVSPYLWSAARDGGKLTLAGGVPNPSARARIVAAAKAAVPGAEIIDQMAFAGGAPGGFDTAAAFSLAALSGLDGGRVDLSNLAYSIAGQAATLPSYRAILDGARKLPDGMSLAAMAVRPPLVKPYVWSLAKDGAAIRLEGFAPDIAGINAAGVAAQAPPLRVDNDLKPGSGLAAGLDHTSATAFAASLLGKLKTGLATVKDGVLSLKGEAYGSDRALVLERLKAALAGGLTLGTVDIRDLGLSPAELQAKAAAEAAAAAARAAEAARIKAAEEAAAAEAAAARARAEAEAKARAAAAQQAAAEVDGLVSWLRSLLKSGTVEARDGALAIAGETYTPHLLAILDRLKGVLPGGLKLGAVNIVDLGAPTTDAPRIKTETQAKVDRACQFAFSGVLSSGRILFRTGSALISDESSEVLDALIRALRGCADSEVEIAGHTDDDGDPGSNLDLSRRRAQAVVDYLVKAGIPAAKLSFAGYGQTRPVASNETAEGKARNRRIEFVVK